MTDAGAFSPPPTTVFDTEPLVAHADGENGKEKVSAYLNSIDESVSDGYLSQVNATEVRYILARKYDTKIAAQYLSWLDSIGVELISSDLIYPVAADYVLEYNPALGDAYALATAEYVNGTLLVGADDDYDDIISDSSANVSIERFRTSPH
jgi:predicted nucleic acid-binding protein